MLADIPRLITAYFVEVPDPNVPEQRVSFGTSGHRGSSLARTFNERHILAITQAICSFRQRSGIAGPLFVGFDTHPLSHPAFATSMEVLAANAIETMIADGDEYTPTPALSHAILGANQGFAPSRGQADGIVVTPSHNPPEDGGFKYNPPNGGPADTDVTRWIQDEANRILEGSGGDGLAGVKRIPFEQARAAATGFDFRDAYVDSLQFAVDLEAVAASGLRIGVDPLGGASVDYWAAIGSRYGLDLTVTNDVVDPQWAFMTLDWDGRIRMDPSSPFAMARLVELRDQFDLALGNDADADRHGVVVPGEGLMNPNHVLAVFVSHLFGDGRPLWGGDVAVGKTLVSSSIIDRIVASLGRRLLEVPVGFKWFVDGLVSGSIGFGGEESAGASFLRRDGTVWTTDKDGIVACLLAAEITARTGRNPGELYASMTERFGAPAYRRIDAPATPEGKAALGKLAPDDVTASTLGGDPIVARLTRAPGNDAPIGGIKVATEQAWFAARPSGTENVTKLYAESFRGEAHLEQVLDEARGIIDAAIGAATA